MAFSFGNMYCIPEHPAENFIDEQNSAISLSVKETSHSKLKKKMSNTSLPDQTPEKKFKSGLNYCDTSTSTSMATSKIISELSQDAEENKKSPSEIHNRLTVSLSDFSNFGLTSDSGSLQTDKRNPFTNTELCNANSVKNSVSYLKVQDSSSHSIDQPQYEKILSERAISASNLNTEPIPIKNNHTHQPKEGQVSENLIIIEVSGELERHQSAEDLEAISVLRQRSQSLQWIQTAFQNVSDRYKNILEHRRPSDIVEEHIRKSEENLEMDEHQYEVLSTTKQCSSPGGRRFSENIIGKQKRFPFSSQLGRLKDLWKDRNFVTKRQEEKDIDQTRPDVCPLFTFPRKGDEDERILDALRQAMRKCTVVDPSSRPSSTTVLDQLSNLLH